MQAFSDKSYSIGDESSQSDKSQGESLTGAEEMAKSFISGLFLKASEPPKMQYNIVINSGAGPEASSNSFVR